MSRSFCPWGLLWIRGLGLLSATLALRTGQQILSCDGPRPPVVNLRFAYNGEEVARFDYTAKKFAATSPLAEPYIDELNRDARKIKNMDHYSHFAPLIAETILRVFRSLTAKPSITITAQRLNGEKNPLFLNCRVSGFYPRDINTTWLRNGEAIQQEVLWSRILPNKDGSFQVSLQVNVDPRRGDSYTCQVEHRSVPDKLTAVWAPKSQNLLAHGYVVGIISGVAGLIIAVSGGIIRRKVHYASSSQPGLNQSQANAHSAASNTDSGVWLQGESEQLCEEFEQPPSSTPA